MRTEDDQTGFLDLAEKLSFLIAIIRDERFTYVNATACSMLGYTKNALIGRPVREVIQLGDHAASSKRGIARLIRADGRNAWLDCTTDAIELGEGPATIVTGYDVTERKCVEEELRRSESQLAEAQRIAHVGGWEWDVAKNHVVWSDELFRILGLDRSRVEPSHELYLSMLHPDDRAAVIAEERDGAQDGPLERELRLIRDGEIRTVWTSGCIDTDARGRPIRVFGAVQDITDRRRAEEALRDSNERFRVAFTHAAIGKAIVTLDFQILKANAAVCRMLGYSEAELLARRATDFTHPDDLEEATGFIRRLVDENLDSGSLETRCLHKDGRTVWAILTATVVRDGDGRPLYFIAESQDVTERRRAELALKESEARFRNLCIQAPVMLAAYEPDGKIHYVSDVWLDTMGYTRAEVIGRDGLDFITPESRRLLLWTMEENRRNQETVIRNLPVRGIRKDGTMVDLLNTSVAHVGDDGKSQGAICVSLNVTEVRRAEETLLESEERYRALVEHAPEAIMVLDVHQGHFVDVNAHAERLFGYSRDRLFTMGLLDFCPQRSSTGCSIEEAKGNIQEVLAGETSVFEFDHVTPEGVEVRCQARLSRLPAVGRDLIRVTITDISELKQLDERVRNAENLAAVGVLAAGVAHEIGNPLAAVSMATQSLERRSCDDYSKKKLTLIREHIDRISRIVRQMADLARPRRKDRGPCDVSSIVRRALDVVRYDTRAKGAEIQFDLVEPLPEVQAVEDELTQVCINLALNAFDAMSSLPADRTRRLTIRSEVVDHTVRVSFRDTGPGVPRDVRPRLFQPFFTTKEVGRGTGLGLSISYRILQEHNGSLWLDERTIPGASFVFELPLAVAA